jgi:hypothetical protein
VSTRSCLARPTTTGFTGIYVHFDGYPSHHLPLLLAAYQHRFGGDVEAMAQHLIDTVAVGWENLGADLLDGVPEPLHAELAKATTAASRSLDNDVTPSDRPASRMTVDETSARKSWLEWAYVLHPHGLEVIDLIEHIRGPVVDWTTDPRTRFNNNRRLWRPDGPVPATKPPHAAQLPVIPAQPTTTGSAARSSVRR